MKASELGSTSANSRATSREPRIAWRSPPDGRGSTVAPVVATVPPAPSDTEPPTQPVERNTDAASAPSNESPPQPCPDGAVRVAASTIDRLDPPEPRPHWPQRRAARDLQVTSFCMARVRVSADRFAQCVGAGNCQWQGVPEQGTRPATHLRAQDADRYSHWRGGLNGLDGSLPSITEWEAAARSGFPAIDPPVAGSPMFEWVRDPAFPSL
jgi:formylglycine-generating enzyme required for sulfatase activity